MKFKQGDMWSAFDEADLFLVTANSTVRKDGFLVMGKGIALEAAQKFPQIPKMAGAYLINNDLEEKFYGVIHGIFPQEQLGLFQTKFLFASPTPLMLIEMSCKCLVDIIKKNNFQNIHLNFPGVGYEKQSRGNVLPILTDILFEHNVTIWEK